ncbi:threonine-phosphate decarboxylase CobD [Haladaptatus sp. AB643]|uniref:threonine-phosphate decarboxylase CobD n=1 Tax=Haladaptatus sp. AB643 TaxID=2934174 RepID=UPI00209C6B68|nr:threonine-phosphate decarboxylase CobD [Haladaptatus sp. AB643]MCO8245458.1 threonine-phosphate decarboxylase CobD [Haladaptatus sp. AB643]
MDPDAIRAVKRVPHGSSDDPYILDFSANTNPLIPDGVTDVYMSALHDARTYPPESPTAYRAAAADFAGCEADQVVPTPGGLAAIRLAIETTVQPSDSVLVPAPSFAEYTREVRLQGADPVFVTHDAIPDTDPSEYALAIVCNPNNPTGECYDAERLRSFAASCREAGTPLLVDEAFLGFTDQPSLAGTPGVVVARSLTKLFGLPGLRAGFAVATGTLLDELVAARRTWNVGRPALDVGTYCLEREEFVSETRQRVAEERERMRDTLSGHYEVHASDAPFLLLDVGGRNIAALVEAVRERGIAIRDATTFRGLDSHIRVAVRLSKENDRLLEVLEDV